MPGCWNLLPHFVHAGQAAKPQASDKPDVVTAQAGFSGSHFSATNFTDWYEKSTQIRQICTKKNQPPNPKGFKNL